jgi:hypothetical protein
MFDSKSQKHSYDQDDWFNITKTFIRPKWLFDSISQTFMRPRWLLDSISNVFVILNQTSILVLWMRLWYWIKQSSWSCECFCDIESNSHLGHMNVFVVQYHKNIHKTNMAVWFNITKTFIRPRWLIQYHKNIHKTWMFLWYWIKQPSWSYECFCDIESNSHPGLMNVYVILNQTAMLVLCKSYSLLIFFILRFFCKSFSYPIMQYVLCIRTYLC